MNGEGAPKGAPEISADQSTERDGSLPARCGTVGYLDGRERILGDRLNLSRRPEEAARELTEALAGMTFAARWARAVLKALDGER